MAVDARELVNTAFPPPLGYKGLYCGACLVLGILPTTISL